MKYKTFKNDGSYNSNHVGLPVFLDTAVHAGFISKVDPANVTLYIFDKIFDDHIVFQSLLPVMHDVVILETIIGGDIK